MVKNNNNKVTLEVLNDSLGNLAGMVAKGFGNTVNKQEFNDFRSDTNNFRANTNKRFDKLEFKVDEMRSKML